MAIVVIYLVGPSMVLGIIISEAYSVPFESESLALNSRH